MVGVASSMVLCQNGCGLCLAAFAYQPPRVCQLAGFSSANLLANLMRVIDAFLNMNIPRAECDPSRDYGAEEVEGV